jgi:hypothetical protein
MGVKRKTKKVLLVVGLVLLVGGILAVFGLKWIIDAEVNRLANHAVEHFQKDRIESLIALVMSDEFDIGQKDNAIWALGILEDKRALPLLDSLYTGEPCDHANEICQYEVKKAILKIKGEYRGSWRMM